MCTNQKHFFAVAFITASLILSSVSVHAQTPPSSNPPVISGVIADNITQSSAMISWNTDVPATTRLDYGTTIAYEINSIIESSLRTFHQIQVSPLDTDTTYHYRVRSTDASGRERVDTDHTFTTKPPLDYTPPEEITSLRVASATVTSLVLTWVAPGGNGSTGTSTSYEIRASYTTIPEIGALQWWNSATVLNNTLTPRGPGSQESYTAQNLATSTKYYFAVRARDKAGNISPLSISDVRSGTTLAASSPSYAGVSASSSTVAASSTISAGITSTNPMTSLSSSAPGAPNSVTPLPAGSAVSPIAGQATSPTLFTGNLSYGMRSESVRTLQRILIAKGLLREGNDSGFFGSLTLAAVKKFQCSQKIVCSGSARTTGYGFVGAKTRAKLGGM
ncbi:MAG: fibronectin type III domain-containing protein [Candidatus Sungbacteria bacterium]|nr:fibronectin type III domain-containing protein [Candidatus Sungbacteria bacterium]